MSDNESEKYSITPDELEILKNKTEGKSIDEISTSRNEDKMSVYATIYKLWKKVVTFPKNKYPQYKKLTLECVNQKEEILCY